MTTALGTSGASAPHERVAGSPGTRRSRSERTIVVGDVHGCREELEELLDRVAFASGDQLIFVGDIVARGPDSRGVLDVVRRTGAILVRGNHEQKLLDLRAQAAASSSPSPPRIERGRARAKPPLPVRPTRAHVPNSAKLHAELAARLRPVDWTLLETSPLRVDLKDHDLTVVHAGVLPGLPLDEQRPEVLLRVRTVRSSTPAVGLPRPRVERRTPSFVPDIDEQAKRRTAHALWGSRWEGPPHIVFGHNAAPGLQLHPWATGLDTGCVYGGRLTALVLRSGQKVPRSLAARRALLVSVPARRVWWQPEGVTPRLYGKAPAT